MKRIILTISLLAMLCLCACGEKSKQTGSVSPDSGFDNAGFVKIICDQSGTCTFTANDASIEADITWEAYLFDKEFNDAVRLIPQAKSKKTISFNASGEMKVSKGNHLYIHCSENGFTLDSKDSITKDAKLTYTIE